MPTLFGSAIKRREDPRLITGAATYVDDVKLPGLTYAAIHRSPYAHAKITRVDVDAARKAPGVIAVFTGADIKDKVTPVPCAWNPPNCDLKVPPHPLLAHDRVRYVGDGVAMVVAETRAAARDAIDLIDVDYDTLQGGVDPEKMAQPGAPQLHDEVPNNIAFTWVVAGGDAEQAFKSAEVTVQTAHRAAATAPHRDGAARGRRQLQQGHGPAHALGHQPEPTHPSVPLLGDAAASRASDPGHRARGRRRVRQQDPGVSRRGAGELRRDAARPTGEVDRRSLGELQGHDPRPRSHPARRDVRYEGRPDHRASHEGVRRARRVRLHRGAGHPDDSPRPRVLGRLPDPEHPRHDPRRLYLGRAGGRLPRRRPARSDAPGRATGRPLRPQDRHGPRGSPAEELHSEGQVPVRRRHGADLRFGKLRAARSTRRSTSSTTRLSAGSRRRSARRAATWASA